MVNIKFICFIDLAWMIIHYSDYSSWSTSIVYSTYRPGWLSITCVHYCRQGGFDPQGMVMCHHAFQSSSPLGQHKSSPETGWLSLKKRHWWSESLSFPIILRMWTQIQQPKLGVCWTCQHDPCFFTMFTRCHVKNLRLVVPGYSDPTLRCPENLNEEQARGGEVGVRPVACCWACNKFQAGWSYALDLRSEVCFGTILKSHVPVPRCFLSDILWHQTMLRIQPSINTMAPDITGGSLTWGLWTSHDKLFSSSARQASQN